MNDFWKGYSTACVVILAVSLIGNYFSYKEALPQCLINTHLTTEQYSAAVGIKAEFFGVSNGDVLVLANCK
jgi:hypothetical protein